ncbi:MAG: ArnT family glycosyltransferase [Candidatus Hodarchaeota archaeon]
MTSVEEETISNETNSQTDIPPVLKKTWKIISEFKFILLIAFLAFFVKVAYTSSIDMWDEGWFAAIFSRMADGLSDPFLPLYYPAEGGDIKFFDKPPAAFWGGAILMNIFGRTTFAAKGIVILGGAGLAVIVYFLFSHQAENKSGAVIAGLLVALANFLNFYSRTAYIDPFVVFMSALVMLFAVRMVDAVFVENNMRKGYILLIIMFIVNVFNILTKAWQGILTFPAIAIYLLFRYLERHIRKEDLKYVWNEIRFNFILSPKKMSSSLYVTFNSIDIKVPLPFIVMLIAFACSFVGSYIITNLIASSLILAAISGIGCYIVFLRISVLQDKLLSTPGFVSGSIAGFIGGISGGFVVKVFYGRLANSFIEIAQALGEEDLSSSLLSGLKIFSNSELLLITLELIASLFGMILLFIVVILVSGVILDLFTHEYRFIRIVFDILDVVPLAILGFWFVFWFAGILLLGLVFERDAINIGLFGTLITLFLIPVVTGYPRIKNYISNLFKLNSHLRPDKEIANFESHLLFASITIILLILSFIPFVSWVQYLDTNIANGTFPWVIRTPGELSGDPNKPNPVTYTFLFFEYYISWRYTHGTKYSLASSIGSAINDYALWVLLPFFVLGIYAFFFSDKRNPALGSLFITWLVTIPFIFFPAQFQLNYYYIPLAIPFMAVAAKGIEYIYSSEKVHLPVVDNVERFLATVIAFAFFYQSIIIQFILDPINRIISYSVDFFIGNIGISGFINNLQSINYTYSTFIILIYLVPFLLVSFRVLKTFIGIFSVGGAYCFFITVFVKLPGLYNFILNDLIESLFSFDFSWVSNSFELGAPIVTLIGVIVIIFVLYMLKPRVKSQVFIFLTLILSGMLINVSTQAHYNQILDLGFQEMAIYINNHGGNYNYSTWVISEAGAEFGMRYYLGYEITSTGNRPFSYNSSFGVESFYRSNSNIKFWVIINDTHWHLPDYSEDYAPAYRWFTSHEHLVCVDDIIGVTSWYKIHLFVNKTWISEQGYDWTKLKG